MVRHARYQGKRIYSASIKEQKLMFLFVHGCSVLDEVHYCNIRAALETGEVTTTAHH